VGALEMQIDQWRGFVARSGAVDEESIEELEGHLREQIAELREAGLDDDEAFLVSVKRLGSVDGLSREFAREHSGRLWKQLVLSSDSTQGRSQSRLGEAIGFAVATAIAIQALVQPAIQPDSPASEMLLVRNAPIVVLVFLSWYFARSQRLATWQVALGSVPFAVAALVVNLFPWATDSSTHLQTAIHTPVVLWFAVAYSYMGGDWRSHERRMDFVRFTGEWFIYYVLIALGGGGLAALTALILEPLGNDIVEAVFQWVLPSGAAGAVIVAAWLVQAKQSVIENMAPVLTKVFTPLLAVMLVGWTVAYTMTGIASAFDRELLAVFDALLIVTLGLVLYGISARDPSEPPGLGDGIQLVAVGGALLLDAMVLWSMIARIGDLGFTPNRVAALGLNLVLLVNLAWAAWLLIRFLRRDVEFHRLERWQTAYLPVFPLWAAAVAVVLPLVFAFS
jgi:hypothetical protein